MSVPPTTMQTAEAKLQRQMLDWMEVYSPKAGDILVVRMPEDRFIYPGTPPEEIPDEKIQVMNALRSLIEAMLQNLKAQGIEMAGACILADGMRLEDLPPPAQQVHRPDTRILLPPGTKL